MKGLLFSWLVVYLVQRCSSQSIQCTHGWIRQNSKCYFLSNTKETYVGASAFCHAFDSKLAEPITQDEVTFLSKTVADRGNHTSFYIGVNDIFLEGEWVYAYVRTPLKVQPPWINGGPDNFHEEDCVELYSTNDGKWTDVKCTTRLYYICEYDIEAEPLPIG
ncbi:collectin-11-like [Ostrea edulis]|uniref:collectin-11-like n=1 Tax=Ostrea edulis TaxID=37623 RepID=UPI00209420EF|nr:collectin-11-like [Ostrea edulis]